MLKILISLSTIVFLSSCALKRHPASGYSGPQMQRYSSALGATTNDSSYTGQNPGAATLADSGELKSKESQLSSQQEKKQYYHYKSLLKTDAQRQAFLDQPNMAARNNYAKSVLFPIEKRDFSQQELEMISKRDIALGMSQKAVEESWGNPIERMPAGNPIRGNEMWVYKKLVPTSNGYNTELRNVYFESGHVAGWETKKK